MSKRLSAGISSRNKVFIDSALVGLVSLLIVNIILKFSAPGSVLLDSFSDFYLITFLFVCFFILLSVLDRPYKVSKKEQSELNKLNVTVVVPAYNEDPLHLERCVVSLIKQSRRPSRIIVVDDGSNLVSYYHIKRNLFPLARSKSVKLNWYRTENDGKRSAQCFAFKKSTESDIYVTVDSDTILDKEAIKEGLKPFNDKRVTSVAGVVLANNATDSFIGRITDNWYVSSQLSSRSGLSVANTVLVNSGALAFYRPKIILSNMNSYLSETFFGREVKMSDDSMLTLYAKLQGKTVQQLSSMAFTSMPTSLDHHLRQYTRWMRGSFIRSWWRIKYLPLNSLGFWYQVYSWFIIFILVPLGLLMTFSDITLLFQILLYGLIVNIIYSFSHTVRYLQVVRNDMNNMNKFINFLLTPLALIWAIIVLRATRVYACLTVFNNDWGTRKKVEITSGA